MNPLDGDYKFNHCIHRSQNTEVHESTMGTCCGGGKRFITGHRCNKRHLILHEGQGPQMCATCWAGEEIIGQEIKEFPKPFEIK